ncbi:hypothetical protein D3C74_174020 [compost metagenome]
MAYDEWIFGVDAFRRLAEDVLAEGFLDLRQVRLLYEHKLIMSMRLDYISKMDGSYKEISERYFQLKKV